MRIQLAPETVKLFQSVGGAEASLSGADNTPSGTKPLRLDFKFSGNGYVSLQIPVTIKLPENYKLVFDLAGTGHADLQIKLVEQVKLEDKLAQNVWWVSCPHVVFGKQQTIKNKKRHFSFAWGVKPDPLVHVDFIELTLVGASGSAGYILLDNLDFEELPFDSIYAGTPVVSASSGKSSAKNIFVDDSHSGWRSSKRERQSLIIDFGCAREFGGIVIDWAEGRQAADYDLLVRDEEHKRWKVVDTVRGGCALRQYHFLPESDTRLVRIRLLKATNGQGYQLLSCQVEPLSFGSSANELLHNIALAANLGFYPRAFPPKPEQSFWTVVGVPGSQEKALINEEGMIEVRRGGPSIEPFLFDTKGQKLFTWRDGHHSQALADGYLPIPSVVRQHGKVLKLTVQACAYGEADSSALNISYTLENIGEEEQEGLLALALRHLQVLPPWQFLSTTGGFSPLHRLSFEPGGKLLVNDSLTVIAEQQPDSIGVTCLSRDDIVHHLARNSLPQDLEIDDPHGLASAAWGYRYSLKAGESVTISLAVPFQAESEILPADQAVKQSALYWQNRLSQTKIELPQAKDLVDTIKSQLAYILITCEGAMIQPGSRSYRRVWIRDAAMMASALLQHGFVEEVRKFIEWFAPFQFPQGKIPCCVDSRGADSVPENDAMGEFIYLLAEYYRYSGDTALLQRLFPQVLKAAEYINSLRQLERSPVNESPQRKRFYGLMPPSISHEGYSDKAAYSYFDDAWTYTGLRDAVFIANVLSESESEERLAASRDEFLRDLLASIKATMEFYNFHYIAGAADRGDIDPTSTTIFLAPAWLNAYLGPALKRTMDKGFEFFLQRLNGKAHSDSWTPYEWRLVEAYIRLNQSDRAHAAIDYFMAARRPAAWNHWAEVVYMDPLKPGFIGDAPHCWVGSDFLRSVRSLFAYETQDGLVVFAGLKDEWLDQGLRLENLPTHYGRCSLRARRVGDTIAYTLEGQLVKPVFLRLPAGYSQATVSGKTLAIEPETDMLRIETLPARVLFER